MDKVVCDEIINLRKRFVILLMIKNTFFTLHCTLHSTGHNQFLKLVVKAWQYKDIHNVYISLSNPIVHISTRQWPPHYLLPSNHSPVISQIIYQDVNITVEDLRFDCGKHGPVIVTNHSIAILYFVTDVNINVSAAWWQLVAGVFCHMLLTQHHQQLTYYCHINWTIKQSWQHWQI